MIITGLSFDRSHHIIDIFYYGWHGIVSNENQFQIWYQHMFSQTQSQTGSYT